MSDNNLVRSLLSKFFSENIHSMINEFDDSVLVSRPCVAFCIPNSVKVTSSNHEVGTFLDDKFRIDLYNATLNTPSGDHKKVEHPVYPPCLISSLSLLFSR